VQVTLAFSGSDLLPHHQHFLQNDLGGSFYDFRGKGLGACPPVCRGATVVQSLKQLKEEVGLLVEAQTAKTPVIIVADSEADPLSKHLVALKMPTEVLRGATKERVDACLGFFAKRQNDRYPVFIVGESQGRGLDFGTNAEIEAAGGVFLVIATLPSHYLQYQQFLGRTGRVGNKG